MQSDSAQSLSLSTPRSFVIAPKMTDFRALCAELSNSLETLHKQSVTTPHNQTLEIRGRLYAIPVGIDILAQDCLYGDLIKRARAALAQPEGGGASVEQVAQIVYENAMLATAPDDTKPHWPSWADLPNSDARIHALNTADTILARWGRSTPQPIPVSERLPGEGDCDVAGRCFWFAESHDGLDTAPIWAFTWRSDDDTHWLPHWALPLPQSK